MSAGQACGQADGQTESQAERLRTFAHLAGLLEAELPGEVLARRLRVVVDERALRSDAGQVLALTVTRLVPRLCDRIDFVAPVQLCLPRLRPLLIDEQFSGASLARLARTIWPEGHFTCDSGEPADYVLALGGCAGNICVGIDRDGAAVVAESPCPIERPDAVFAALAAAGLGCAQTAKLLYPEIIRSCGDPLVRLDRGPFGGPLDPLGPIVLERPALAGVGAVGCAFVYAMIAVGASGRLLLLDRDIVKDSNLMRYILFDTRHLGEAKVDAAKELIEACGVDIEVDTDRKVIQAYLEANLAEREQIEVVVSAVDTGDARRQIAAELPRIILNAGTTARDFTVSRHGFGDGQACLACLYPPRQVDIERTAVMARELGLEKDEVARLMREKEPLSLEQLKWIAQARGLPDDRFAGYLGDPLDTLYNKAICAEARAPGSQGTAVAPLAHGSALGGFLLAHGLAFSDASEHPAFPYGLRLGTRHPSAKQPESARRMRMLRPGNIPPKVRGALG
jgi:molybdopterin/thiamine biosynthesis adenylyltransferase